MSKRTITNKANAISNFIKEMADSKGARIVSFIYENEYSISRVSVVVGISVLNLYKKDIEVFTELKNHTINPQELQQIEKILESRQNSLTNGIGNNTKYTCKGVYEQIGETNSPVKMHIDNGTIYIKGLVISKKVLLKKKDYPKRNSKPETIIKNKLIAQYSKSDLFRQYTISLDTIHSISFKGNKVTIKSNQFTK